MNKSRVKVCSVDGQKNAQNLRKFFGNIVNCVLRKNRV